MLWGGAKDNRARSQTGVAAKEVQRVRVSHRSIFSASLEHLQLSDLAEFSQNLEEVKSFKDALMAEILIFIAV